MDPERRMQDVLNALDGSLGPQARSDLERRMLEDPELARAVAEHRRLDSWLGELEGAEPSTGSLARMARAISSGAPQRVVRSDSGRGRWLRSPMLRLAAAVVVLVGGAWIWRLTTDVEPGGPTDPGVAQGPSVPTQTSLGDEPPDFLDDPEFSANFDVIRDLGELEQLGEELALPQDEQLLDVVTLQILSGA